MEEKLDIESREDLLNMVTYFYEIMLEDELMAHIFNHVAKIDLKSHLPHLVDFWHSLLFMTGAYKKNVMEMHLALHLKHKLEKIHFERWLYYFEKSVNDLFAGPKSEVIKERARSIALLMEFKTKQMDGNAASQNQ